MFAKFKQTIPWYVKLALLFKKPYYGIDTGSGDMTTKVKVKYLNGVMYVMDITYEK